MRKDHPHWYLSAYGIAVRHGFVGTEEEWLMSLVGPGIELRVSDGVLEYRAADGSGEWQEAADLSELQTAVEAATLAQAQAAKTAAEAAQAAAEDAQAAAETAQAAAEEAQETAESARNAAELAQTGAQNAQQGAELARTAAVNASGNALGARTAAQAAERGARTAVVEAQAAKAAAETAQSRAETAAAAAEDAQEAAEQALLNARAAVREEEDRAVANIELQRDNAIQAVEQRTGELEDHLSALATGKEQEINALANQVAEMGNQKIQTMTAIAEDVEQDAEDAEAAKQAAQTAAQAAQTAQAAAEAAQGAAEEAETAAAGSAASARADAEALSDAIWQLDASRPLTQATVSGELVTVDDAAAMNAIECITTLEPIQAGSGDPSPDNIRPISGHTGATLAQARTIADPADWDWMGIDEDVPVDTSIGHVLTVGAKNIVSYGKIPFDPQQYLFAITAESLAWLGISGTALPAGTYNVTLDHGAYNGGTAEDGTFQFTTTQPVPVGGGIRHSYMGTYQSSNADYGKAKVLAGTFTTYDADRTTVIEEGLATTEGSEGTSLGTTTASNPSYKVGDYINFTQRQQCGSNRWSTSFMRQYLNSDEETMTFTPATIWSRPMATLPEGFLHTLDPKLKAVLCKVRTRYALPIADGYGYEDIEDLVKLDTMLDIFGSQNNSIAEGPVDADGNVTRRTAYSMWKPLNKNADRIKYQGTTARHWWLASTYPLNAHNERSVNASGALSYHLANNTNGVVPSLYIALDDLHTAAFVDGEGAPLTVYGGTLDWQKGTLTVRPYYSSYNGEALMGRWISSMDVYADGTTPTNGAQVVDLDGAGTTYQLTPQQIRLLRGKNALRSADGSTELTYYVDDVIMLQKQIDELRAVVLENANG